MATPQKLRCRIQKITDHGDHVYTADLSPERPLPRFKPGQFLHLTLDDYDPSGFWPESRVFSIASSLLYLVYSLLTNYHLIITIQCMNVLMDADCLIKFTKAGLKEAVCTHLSVVIPQVVKREVIDLGKNHPDSMVIKDNLDKGLLSLSGVELQDVKGEEAALAIFQKGGCGAILSDDKRFVRRLRALDVPYITPAVCIFLLLKQGEITLPDAVEKLELLSPLISSDEYNTVKWVLDTWRSP